MSRTNLAIGYLLIVTLALFGVWLGSVATDSTDFRRWLGLTLLVAAFIGLVLIYRRDLRPSAEEKEFEWQHVKTNGKIRYVVIQVLSSQLVWLPLLIQWVLEVYKDGWQSEHYLPPWWWVVLAASGAPFAFVYSMSWWRRQERKYSTRVNSSAAT